MIAAVTIAGLWMVLSIHTFLLRFPIARREVIPRPLTVGVAGRVTVSIGSEGAESGGMGRSLSFSRAMINGLDIREQASSELTGSMGAKATVTRTATSLTLSYPLRPTSRGRWPLGPALVHSSDPLGIVTADISVGAAENIIVWPSVVDLSATAGALMGHADQAVLGARTASPDDTALRDYREGDDLRRVHWKSSAKHGTMLVRSDERADRRPASVIMGLPRDTQALEWTISASASIALSILESGHPVRLLGGGLPPDVAGQSREHSSIMARASLLNQTVDLKQPFSAISENNELVAAGRAAALSAPSGEVIVGMFEPLSKEALDILVPIGGAGRAWAIVRTDTDPQHQQAAKDTAKALRRAGWRTTTAAAGSNLGQVWNALMASGDME